VLLAIAAFSLSLLGTFLVRSGVLTSVHAFASDPKRGVFILIFLAVVVGTSLMLFAWRAPRATLGGSFEWISRESFLLTNSVMLVVATAAVLLGTVYPLIIDALNLGKLSVGPPYFNAVFVPLLVPVLFLVVPGSVSRWREAQVGELLHKLRWPAGLSVVLALVVPMVWGHFSLGTVVGLLLGCWIALGTLQLVIERWRKPGRIPASFWGQHSAHFGLAVLVLGITGVSSYQVERDVRMRIGDQVTIAPYTFRLTALNEVTGPNYKAMRADVDVQRDGQFIEVLQPEKRRYFSSPMPMTEAAIDSGFLRDLYVSLGEPLDDARTEWSMRVYYKPFVPWLWAGVLLMVLGGLLAALDRRYRRAKS
jgi:cytochrome c-type biogenesis protein CcmF